MRILGRTALVSVVLAGGVLAVAMIVDSLECDWLWHRVDPEDQG